MNYDKVINKENMEKPYALACKNLGANRNNESVEIAVNILKKLAELGYILAQTKWGENYEYGLYTDQNDDNAFYYYIKAAEQGDANSQFKIGSFFWNGKGVKKKL